MTWAGEWGVENSELLARRAQSFGPEAAAYDEHRPDYPMAAVRWALEPVGGGGEALDLGAGTGKLTGVLHAAGVRVVAVEPDDGMRAALVRRHPETPAFAGTAESIPLPDDSVHAVLVGQAFHWFDQERALPEIARVLRPGGVLAAFWNSPDTSVEWVAELDRVSRSGASFTPVAEQRLPSHRAFQAFEQNEFPHTQRRNAESLTATIGTHSHTLVIPPEERAEVLARITAYLRGRTETATGEFELPLRTQVIRAVVRP
ncbi:class I SAM-dependent methyltransferase [Nocardia sp. 2]|uniref:Class I SAM-dependent methyltransferase n=1 Tax=Nocardia acididurans TaxID=2802282 RepID=A0ABS1MEE4_9NOCA|nr:class I SAM-dependent methyltransferase [Nocardia acididurans]MBL1078922.1 class I SAM-dependent methyltransferase [Nocardia acididurans]